MALSRLERWMTVWATFAGLSLCRPDYAQGSTSVADNGAGTRSVGSYLSMAIVNGNRAISYYVYGI